LLTYPEAYLTYYF